VNIHTHIIFIYTYKNRYKHGSRCAKSTFDLKVSLHVYNTAHRDTYNRAHSTGFRDVSPGSYSIDYIQVSRAYIAGYMDVSNYDKNIVHKSRLFSYPYVSPRAYNTSYRDASTPDHNTLCF
jgi:hypothetical protein